MTAFLQLRSANSGAPFVGSNQDDTVLWDATARAWYVGPGGGGGAVSSVYGRVGAVVAATGDYDGDQVDNVSTVPGASLSDALDYLLANAGAVASVFGRTGTVTAATGDYDGDQVDNVSTVPGASLSDALDYLLANAGAVASVFGRTGTVTAATGDYDTDQVDNLSSVPGSTTSAALNALGPTEAKAVAALTNADATVATTTRLVLLPSTLTVARQLTVTPTATPFKAFGVDVGTQGFNYTIANGGPALGSVVIAAGQRVRVWLTSDGSNVVFTIVDLGQEPTLA